MYVTIPLGTSLTGISYGIGSLGNLIGNVVGFGITLGAVFTLLWLLLGGISWITSSGDKAKLEQARDQITQAIVGLAIVMSVWGLWFLITHRFFGLNLTGGGGGTINSAGTCLCDNWAPCGQTHVNTDPNAPDKYCRKFYCDPATSNWRDVGPATNVDHSACP